MSQENVEVFKHGVEAYNLRDVLLEDFGPDVEWQPVLQMLLGGEATVDRGHQGVRDWFRARQPQTDAPNVCAPARGGTCNRTLLGGGRL
jgi:hypothetical protein